MQQHLSVRNATLAATAWAASPVGRLVRVEVLVTVSCCLLAVPVFLGSGRRGSCSATLRVAVGSALMLGYPAVSYTIGLMQSASFRNELVVVWGCFLLLVLGCADGIAAYSLNDSDQQSRTILNQALQLVYVLLLLLSYVSSLPRDLKILLLFLWFLSASKLAMRLRSVLSVGRDHVLTVDNKFIADHMLHEHEHEGGDEDSDGAIYDASTMTGYKYVVTGGGNGLVTLDLVWQCKGKLLSSDDSATRKRKDLCLSFAMFKLLRRRFGGYPLHEADLNKTRDFVKVGLLNGGHCSADNDYGRLYRVIEVELGFLFDLFYARYPSPDQSLTPDTVLFAAVLATSLSTLFSPTLLGYRAPRGDTTMFDIWLTRMIIILFVILESFQYVRLVFSDWHKVKMLCRYVRDDSWRKHRIFEMLLKFMCNVRLTRYWNNSVGQYWLLYACFQSENSSILRMLSPLPEWMWGFLARSRTTHRRDLTAAVKGAIYRFLKSGLTSIKNGEHTLTKNGMLDSFYWATAQESTVHSILLWHIATTICHSHLDSMPRDAAVMEDQEVATTLSAYCAYLMSSAPELLPDHSYDTQLLFDAVQLTARQRLKGCRSRVDMRERLTFDPDRQQDVSEAMLAEGKRLGDLVRQRMSNPAMQWKVLAELWVEMLLSVAPSSNLNGHVQKLATGGELITHLWALLTHAGIIEKPVKRYQRRGP